MNIPTSLIIRTIYHVDVTVYLGDKHITFGPLTPGQVRLLAKELVEDLDEHLEVFARMQELRDQADSKK